MNVEKINSSNPSVARKYIETKFCSFKKGLITKNGRRKKCLLYWIAAESESTKDMIEEVYQRVFGELLNTENADSLIKHDDGIGKMNSLDWLEDKRQLKSEAVTTLGTLKRWQRENEWQEDNFVERLQQICAFMEEDDLCKTSNFKSEYSAFFEKEVTSSLERSRGEISHEAQFIAAAKQSARVEFDVMTLDWGRINGFFDEQFKAGIWGNESAKLEWNRRGFSAEVKAALAIGAQLNVSGELGWEHHGARLSLGGEGEIFLGGKGEFEGKLSVNAMKGLEAAFKAGFFLGISASISGTAKFTYMGKEVASATGSASVTIGISGEVSGSIAVPLFGPTKISFSAGLTIGIGASASATISIDFNETRILLTTTFRQAIYIPTLLEGYKMDIMNMEYRNSFYLNKCINRVEAFIKETEEEISSYKKKPVEKRPLLRG